MGNKSSLMLQDDEIQVIQNETGCKFCFCETLKLS